MESADIYVLGKLRWQFFGSLTFKSERLPERVRLAMFFALLRRTAKDFRCYFPALPWCLRQERGEITNRRHCHFLLTGLPARAVSVKTCMTLKVRWEQLGGGFARVSEFNPALNGVDYITKCLGHELNGADCYESAKFGGGTCDLMLSRAVWNVSNHARRQTGR
jgi:hypothetical protein